MKSTTRLLQTHFIDKKSLQQEICVYFFFLLSCKASSDFTKRNSKIPDTIQIEGKYI